MNRLGAGLILAGAVLLGAFSRTLWVTAEFTDTLGGGGAALIRGAQWSTETTAVSLLLFVGAIGAFSLRRRARRLVGAICAAAAAGAAVSPLALLTRGPDPERVHALLTAGDTPEIAEWAEITSTTVSAFWPTMSVLGCVVAAVGGVLVAVRPGVDKPKLNKYEKETVRRERLAEDLEARPDSGRVMWDALDAGIDPTADPTADPDFGRRGGAK